MRKENSNLAALPAYDDLWIRIVLSLLAAHFIVVYGDSEDIGKIIRHFNYYNALVASFVISFLVLYVIWLITRFLDKKLNWLLHPLKRVATQFALGVVLPASFAILLAWIYFRMYGYNISETPYFDSDFPVIVLLLLLANVYYFLYYLVVTLWPHAAGGDDQNTQQPDQIANASSGYKKIILVNTLLKTIPVSEQDCRYFFREGKRNFLRKADGELLPVDLSLDELEASLDPGDFFRINRQMIIRFNACQAIVPTEGARLELKLNPAFNKAVLVSETRVAAFRRWMDR